MTKPTTTLLAAAIAATLGLALSSPAAMAQSRARANELAQTRTPSLCTVVAAELDGAVIEETRAEATGPARQLACGDAISLCGDKLTVIRLADGVFPGPLPGAYCRIEQVAELDPAVGCNVSACASAYRSFRRSDCSYVPYVGVRQRCMK